MWSTVAALPWWALAGLALVSLPILLVLVFIILLQIPKKMSSTLPPLCLLAWPPAQLSVPVFSHGAAQQAEGVAMEQG